jgi:xeroderma pigmentosum group C-complementing protein
MAGAGGADGLPAPSSVAVGGRRLPKGERDRFGIAREGCAKCAAHASDPRGGGVVILFYAYVRVSDPDALAARLRAACGAAGVTGKIRVAAEGINGTAAGPTEGVDALIAALESDARRTRNGVRVRTHGLETPTRLRAFVRRRVRARRAGDRPFRRRDTCVRVPVATLPAPVERLEPLAFHAEAKRADGSDEGTGSDVVLLDVRNWYESRVGYFENAVRAPIRRFSQLREWLDKDPFRFTGKRVLAYCTGGVRCEKACAYLTSLDDSRRPRSVAQLSGGVAAYARDVVGSPEEKANPKASTTSLFRGSNFVFDARGATKVTNDVIGWCDGCGSRTDKIDHCASEGCHTLLLVCDLCAAGSHRPSYPKGKRHRRLLLTRQKKKKIRGGTKPIRVSSAAFRVKRKTPSVAKRGDLNAVGRATATGTPRGNDVCCPKSPLQRVESCVLRRRGVV